MTGYLARLATRGRGSEEAGPRPRRAPRLVPAVGRDAVGRDELSASAGAASAEADDLTPTHAAPSVTVAPAAATLAPSTAEAPGGRMDPRSGWRDAPQPIANPASAVESAPHTTPPRADPAEAARGAVPASTPRPPAPAGAALQTRERPSEHRPVDPPVRPAAHTSSTVGRVAHATPAAAPRPRFAPRVLPASPRPAAAPAPRIEVRIGRVEVRAPRPEPPPVPRTVRATAPPQTAPRGFGELAAMRRHLDRIVR